MSRLCRYPVSANDASLEDIDRMSGGVFCNEFVPSTRCDHVEIIAVERDPSSVREMAALRFTTESKSFADARVVEPPAPRRHCPRSQLTAERGRDPPPG
ncbi:hypothetical protein [Pendulispora albinea]|uniref:Uncharacterized protein n=1 Tax=Pendulispora albinea TaxID=2741071 RepID=A0ABZ2M783_9BACT